MSLEMSSYERESIARREVDESRRDHDKNLIDIEEERLRRNRDDLDRTLRQIG